ncbi:MAG: hypothetical protein CME70_05740 [Halobacteriovorax sp.]|nr:hypothetical protein [Halobacteriovorax sp.]
MNEIIIYLASLVEENKLSQKESQIFLDYAHDLVLDGSDDEEIEFTIKAEIKQILKEKENGKLF